MHHILVNPHSISHIPNTSNERLLKDEALFDFSDLSSIRNPFREKYLQEITRINAKYKDRISAIKEQNIKVDIEELTLSENNHECI